jgi:hypothetical protein
MASIRAVEYPGERYELQEKRRTKWGWSYWKTFDVVIGCAEAAKRYAEVRRNLHMERGVVVRVDEI